MAPKTTVAELERMLELHMIEDAKEHKRLDMHFSKIEEDCGDIKTRLDLWNGSIPYMKEKITKISTDIESHSQIDNKIAIEMAVQKTKLGLLLAVLGTVGMAVFGIVIKMIFF